MTSVRAEMLRYFMARPIVDLEDLIEMRAMRLPLEPRALSQSSIARPRWVGPYGYRFGQLELSCSAMPASGRVFPSMTT